MEKAASGQVTGFRRELSFGCCLAVAVGCCLASLPAWAQEADPPRAEPMRLEVDASSLPHLDGQPKGFQAPRVDMALLPASGSGMGIAVGMTGFANRPLAQPGFTAAAQPAVDLGLRWRHTFDSNRQLDVTAWRRMQTQPDAYQLIQQRQPLYGARVEMKLAPSKQGLLMERGFVGMQLQGDARISIKRKDGRPMVYYRNSF